MQRREQISRPHVVTRPQLSEEVALYIRDSIMSGRMASGEHVRIDHVAAELGVSGTPVREALLSLRAEGFVHLDRNRGFRVAPLSEQDVLDLFQVQAFVAGELAARAVSKKTPSLVEDLEKIQEAMKEAARIEDGDRVEELNFQFHRRINTTAASPKLNALIGILLHYVPRRFYAEIPGWPEASVNDHAAIVQALRSRRPQSARKAMTNHILHGGELLVANLRARSFWAAPIENQETQ